MTEARKELTEREMEILELREQKVPYREIAEKYSISQNRVRQIYAEAKRKLREAQRRILAGQANMMIVPTGFSRSQLIIIRESLFALKREKFDEICHTRGNMKDLEENDPVYRKAGQVLEMVERLLNDTREDVLKEIAENSKETVPEMLAIIHGDGRWKEDDEE